MGQRGRSPHYPEGRARTAGGVSRVMGGVPSVLEEESGWVESFKAGALGPAHRAEVT